MKATLRVLGLMEGKNGPLLQTFGTDIYRKHNHENFWLEQLVYRLCEEQPPVALITDVRFSNEAEWVHAVGGKLVLVVRYTEEGRPFVADDRPADHPSEIELDRWTDWDYSLAAESGDFEELARQADDIVDDIRSWLMQSPQGSHYRNFPRCFTGVEADVQKWIKESGLG
jgi:hypothetical protein